MKQQAIRRKSTVWDNNGQKETYPSINLAKKASRLLQQENSEVVFDGKLTKKGRRGLGKGRLRCIK